MFLLLCYEIAVHLAAAGDVFDGIFLCCPFSPRDVLDEIWDLIESVSKGVFLPTLFNILYISQNHPSDRQCINVSFIVSLFWF